MAAYVTLPAVVGVQFSSLDCDNIEGIGVRFLRADANIDCDSDMRRPFLALLVPLIAIYQAVPIMYFILLYRVRHKINPPVSRLEGSVRGLGLNPEFSGKSEHQTSAQNSLKRLGIFQASTTDPAVIPIRFLFEAYRPDLYYFEVFETYRR